MSRSLDREDLPLAPPDTGATFGGGPRVARRPQSLAETGLSERYLADLVSRHLLEAGVLNLRELTECMALAGGVVQEVLDFLRRNGRVEVRGSDSGSGTLQFALTERGRAAALEAADRDGYVGPAPVPLASYAHTAAAQRAEVCSVRREAMHAAFADTVIPERLLDQLGPAVSSGRAVLLHGPSGTGKSFIARRLGRLLGGEALVPHALEVAGKAIRVFDPGVHAPVAGGPAAALRFDEGEDARYVRCRQPLVCTGGELTLDMLEVRYDESTRTQQAPLQLLANHGILIIDDLGRQRMEPVALFNRWIVPLEERRDFLTLRNGHHFEVPFDVTVIFSTNRDPASLADDAFLRRMGHKIRLGYLDEAQYAAIWRQECRRLDVAYDPALLRFVLDERHRARAVPLLACHPRDLITLAADYAAYTGSGALSPEAVGWAWDSYFVGLDEPRESTS